MSEFYLTGTHKYLANLDKLQDFQQRRPCITTADISPTGKCNLKCPECLVGERDRAAEIPYDVICRYLRDVRVLGCRGVLFTGGGEPTLYDRLQDAIAYADECHMRVGLITNGFRLPGLYLHKLSWIRVSYHGQEPPQFKASKDCVVGVSVTVRDADKPDLAALSAFADALQARYVRFVVDGFVDRSRTGVLESLIRCWFATHGDPRFKLQETSRQAPDAGRCHRAEFRPYLSEFDGGTIFPCGLIPFVVGEHKFTPQFAVGKAKDILGCAATGLGTGICPREQCQACQCAATVNELQCVMDADREHSEWV
jgi:hypothetical protein